jgi:hypothetical protein
MASSSTDRWPVAPSRPKPLRRPSLAKETARGRPDRAVISVEFELKFLIVLFSKFSVEFELKFKESLRFEIQ